MRVKYTVFLDVEVAMTHTLAKTVHMAFSSINLCDDDYAKRGSGSSLDP